MEELDRPGVRFGTHRRRHELEVLHDDSARTGSHENAPTTVNTRNRGSRGARTTDSNSGRNPDIAGYEIRTPCRIEGKLVAVAGGLNGRRGIRLSAWVCAVTAPIPWA